VSRLIFLFAVFQWSEVFCVAHNYGICAVLHCREGQWSRQTCFRDAIIAKLTHIFRYRWKRAQKNLPDSRFCRHTWSATCRVTRKWHTLYMRGRGTALYRSYLLSLVNFHFIDHPGVAMEWHYNVGGGDVVVLTGVVWGFVGVHTGAASPCYRSGWHKAGARTSRPVPDGPGRTPSLICRHPPITHERHPHGCVAAAQTRRPNEPRTTRGPERRLGVVVRRHPHPPTTASKLTGTPSGCRIFARFPAFLDLNGIDFGAATGKCSVDGRFRLGNAWVIMQIGSGQSAMSAPWLTEKSNTRRRPFHQNCHKLTTVSFGGDRFNEWSPFHLFSPRFSNENVSFFLVAASLLIWCRRIECVSLGSGSPSRFTLFADGSCNHTSPPGQVALHSGTMMCDNDWISP
jgi:hypothetical protein